MSSGSSRFGRLRSGLLAAETPTVCRYVSPEPGQSGAFVELDGQRVVLGVAMRGKGLCADLAATDAQALGRELSAAPMRPTRRRCSGRGRSVPPTPSCHRLTTAQQGAAMQRKVAFVT